MTHYGWRSSSTFTGQLSIPPQHKLPTRPGFTFVAPVRPPHRWHATAGGPDTGQSEDMADILMAVRLS